MTLTAPAPFAQNWKFQEGYYPQVRGILEKNAMHFVRIEVADPQADMKHATDFRVRVVGGDVAVRIRRSKYQYRDLTIRSYINGYRTEIDKLRDGDAKFYLYCWEHADGRLSEWMLVDLDKVRERNILNLHWNEMTNRDGTKFISIPRQYLRLNSCLIAEQAND